MTITTPITVVKAIPYCRWKNVVQRI